MNVRENKKRPFHATEKPLHKRDEDKLRGTTLLGALRPPYAVPIHGHSITGVPSKSTRCLSIGSSRMSYLSFGIPFCTKQRLSVIRHESCFLSQPINNILYYISKCKPSSRAKAKKLSKKSIFYTSDKTKARDAHLSRRFDKSNPRFVAIKAGRAPQDAPLFYFSVLLLGFWWQLIVQCSQPQEQPLLPCFLARIRLKMIAPTIKATTATTTIFPQFCCNQAIIKSPLSNRNYFLLLTSFCSVVASL